MESTRRAGKPSPLSNRYLSWVLPAWASSQDEIIRVGGFDAAMYVKILSFGELLFARGTINFHVVYIIQRWQLLPSLNEFN